MTKYPAQELTIYQNLTPRNPCDLISGLCQEQTAMTTFPCLYPSLAWWPPSCPPESTSSHLSFWSPGHDLQLWANALSAPWQPSDAKQPYKV